LAKSHRQERKVRGRKCPPTNCSPDCGGKRTSSSSAHYGREKDRRVVGGIGRTFVIKEPKAPARKTGRNNKKYGSSVGSGRPRANLHAATNTIPPGPQRPTLQFLQPCNFYVTRQIESRCDSATEHFVAPPSRRLVALGTDLHPRRCCTMILGAMESERTKPAPACPSCGRLMRFTQSVPALEGFPELRVHECRACGVTVTEGHAGAVPH
jgi:hypothetical protein